MVVGCLCSPVVDVASFIWIVKSKNKPPYCYVLLHRCNGYNHFSLHSTWPWLVKISAFHSEAVYFSSSLFVSLAHRSESVRGLCVGLVLECSPIVRRAGVGHLDGGAGGALFVGLCRQLLQVYVKDNWVCALIITSLSYGTQGQWGIIPAVRKFTHYMMTDFSWFNCGIKTMKHIHQIEISYLI